MKFALMMGAVFISTLAADFAWAKYTAGIAEKRVQQAAIWSSIIVLVGSVTTLAYIKSPWSVVPAVLGAYVGTYIALRKKEPTP